MSLVQKLRQELAAFQEYREETQRALHSKRALQDSNADVGSTCKRLRVQDDGDRKPWNGNAVSLGRIMDVSSDEGLHKPNASNDDSAAPTTAKSPLKPKSRRMACKSKNAPKNVDKNADKSMVQRDRGDGDRDPFAWTDSETSSPEVSPATQKRVLDKARHNVLHKKKNMDVDTKQVETLKLTSVKTHGKDESATALLPKVATAVLSAQVMPPKVGQNANADHDHKNNRRVAEFADTFPNTFSESLSDSATATKQQGGPWWRNLHGTTLELELPMPLYFRKNGLQPFCFLLTEFTPTCKETRAGNTVVTGDGAIAFLGQRPLRLLDRDYLAHMQPTKDDWQFLLECCALRFVPPEQWYRNESLPVALRSNFGKQGITVVDTKGDYTLESFRLYPEAVGVPSLRDLAYAGATFTRTTGPPVSDLEAPAVKERLTRLVAQYKLDAPGGDFDPAAWRPTRPLPSLPGDKFSRHVTTDAEWERDCTVARACLPFTFELIHRQRIQQRLDNHRETHAVLRPPNGEKCVCRLFHVRGTAAPTGDTDDAWKEGTLEVVEWIDTGAKTDFWQLRDGGRLTASESMASLYGVLDRLPKTRADLGKLHSYIKNYLWQ